MVFWCSLYLLMAYLECTSRHQRWRVATSHYAHVIQRKMLDGGETVLVRSSRCWRVLRDGGAGDSRRFEKGGGASALFVLETALPATRRKQAIHVFTMAQAITCYDTSLHLF